MKKKFGLSVLVAVAVMGSQAFAADVRYTTGLDGGGQSLIEFAYNPLPLNEGKNLDKMMKNEIPEDGLARFNETKLGHLGKLTIKHPVKVGETDLEKGSYDCGILAKPDAKFSFVVWTGEGDEAVAHETALDLKKLETKVDYLILALQPAWEGEGSWLAIVFGNYAAAIPVSLGEGREAGSDSAADKAHEGKDMELYYSTGLQVDGDEVLHLAYAPTPYAEGKTFKAMRSGEYTTEQMDEWFNESKKFGKVGTFEIGRDTTIGTLDAPAGEYPCGINVDGDGNFTFVGWADGEKYSTKISLVEQPMVVPHLLQVLTPAGEKGSILRLVFGNVHADIPVGLGGAN